jgi:hypothetical protein
VWGVAARELVPMTNPSASASPGYGPWKELIENVSNREAKRG